MPWFALLLVVHILLAISLLLPSIALPFLLRRQSGDPPSGLTRLLVAAQGTGSLVIGAGLAATGIGLIAVLGAQLLRQPWLLIALVIYAANLLVAALVSRPEPAPPDGARRQRRCGDVGAPRAHAALVAYGMATATGAIGFLMRRSPARDRRPRRGSEVDRERAALEPEERGHDQQQGEAEESEPAKDFHDGALPRSRLGS